MALTNEDLKAISDLLQPIKGDVQGLKNDMQELKNDMQELKNDVQELKNDTQELKRRTTNIELHLENGTDKNIQLLAESFVELTKKLNQAIPVADKNLAYEVKVNYLIERVQILEKEIAELKDKIA